MQPIILRNRNARRPIQGRPDLSTYSLDYANLWQSTAQIQYALEKLPSLTRPALRTSVGDQPGGLLGTRPGFMAPPQSKFRWVLQQTKAQKEALIAAIYRQVLERTVYDGLRLNEEESRLTNGDITVREFVRKLASSDLWIQQFYMRYPNTKIVEKLFKQLLGRGPSNQADIIKYHTLLGAKGLKATVDAMVSSEEYTEVFGDDIVPYARYKSDPANGLDTGAYFGSLRTNALHTYQNSDLLFPSFGPGSQTSPPKQPLLRIPEQIFKGTANLPQILRAAYRQVLEKEPAELERLSEPESRLRNGELSVKEFIRALGYSELYLRLFFAKFDNCKLAEFNFKHFLGRQPASAAELGAHSVLLGRKGLRAAVDSLINSAEYAANFGDDTVPYYRLQAERFVGKVDAPSAAYIRSRNQVQVALYKSTAAPYSTL